MTMLRFSVFRHDPETNITETEPLDGYLPVKMKDGTTGKCWLSNPYWAETMETAITDYEAVGVDMRYLKVQRFRDKQWRAREFTRLIDNYYAEVPWHDALKPIEGHYVHISEKDPALVAYTQSEEKGELDIQTPMKPGRYLTKYYPHLTADQIREYASKVSKPEFSLAHTSEDIVRVYLKGPYSCMSKSTSNYYSSVHPTTVYGAGDLAVAYLENIDDVTARAIVWPERKVWGRMYGDEIRLRFALEAAGYRKGEAADFLGARLLKIKEGGNFVMPYLDDPIKAIDDDDGGEFFITVKNGMTSDRTDGLLNSSGGYCEHCEDDTDPTEITIVYLGDRMLVSENWCSCCVDNSAFYCSGYAEHFADTVDYVETAYGDTYTERYFLAKGGYICVGTGEAYFEDDEERITTKDTGEYYSISYAVENLYEKDGKWYFREPEEDDTTEEGA